jgi:hypothetical protein
MSAHPHDELALTAIGPRASTDRAVSPILVAVAPRDGLAPSAAAAAEQRAGAGKPNQTFPSTPALATPSKPAPLSSPPSLGASSRARRAAPQEKRRHRGGLMTVFVGIAFGQVVLACVLIWWIGYRATTDTAAQLTRQLRASILHDSLDQVNRDFGSAMCAAHQLRFMTQMRFPRMGQLLSVANTTGWLADITKINALYPRIARVGIANKNSLLLTTNRPTSMKPKAIMSDSGLCGFFLAEPTDFGQTNVFIETFITTPIHPPDQLAYNPPFDVDGEIRDTDSPDDIRRYLGPRQSREPFVTKGRAYWTAAEFFATRRGGRRGGWSEPFAVLPTSTQPGFVGVAAVSSVLSAAGTVEWISYALISANDFEQLLAGLPFGAHGKAYLMRPAGKVVSTSDPELTRIINNTTAEIDMFRSEDPWLQRLLPILLEKQLITTVRVTLLNSSDVVKYRDTVYEESFNMHGDSWLMQAQMTTNTTSGLPFFIVIVTRDSGQNGRDRTQHDFAQ